MYEIEEVVTFGTREDDPGEPGTCYTVTVSADNYQSSVIPNVCLNCGEDEVLDVELVSDCDTVTVSGTVYDKETGLKLDDAWVEITVGAEVKNATTANGGQYSVTDVPFDPDNAIKVCAGKVLNGVVEYTPHCLTTYIPECDGSAMMDFELHTEPRSQILLYYGNGGLDPDDDVANDDPDEYYDLKADYEDAGYIVTYDDAWPADPDLEEYKLIVLILPGYDNDNVATNGFNVSQAAQLGLYVHGGGRLVLLVDHEDQAGDLDDAYNVPNDLMAKMSIGITVTDNASADDTYVKVIDDVNMTPYDNEFDPEHLEGDNSQELSLFDGAFEMYESNPDNDYPTIAADKVGDPANDPDEDTLTGWDVIVVSDAEILSDFFQGAGWPEDVAFADNLISYPTGP
jgi:hypothetical protein